VRDDSDAFDYVKVQLPMGGRGDNIAKSALTANQVDSTKLTVTVLSLRVKPAQNRKTDRNK